MRCVASVKRILPSAATTTASAYRIGVPSTLSVSTRTWPAASTASSPRSASAINSCPLASNARPSGRPSVRATTSGALPSAFMRRTAPDSVPVYSRPSGPNSMCSGPISGAIETSCSPASRSFCAWTPTYPGATGACQATGSTGTGQASR